MDDKILEILLQYGIVNPEVALLRHNENRTYKVIDTSNGSVYLLRLHDPVTVNLAGIQHTRLRGIRILRFRNGEQIGPSMDSRKDAAVLRNALYAISQWRQYFS
ncbi:hypothetical protein [Paenibacillus thalictri]|uniref:Uncharacterized protein n=1 Tax=Paenibacillus thalictri TaxID=2527873 RepID=A0A4Q9DD17_9BACL|nr:hypothetical protein [Paenibacillus thalictri]TBL68599.1 hypothetical protein EYB31_37600 [Paenibacillus thalictri]